jgi:hypothetical protein
MQITSLTQNPNNMQKQPLKRTVTFFIKGNLTQVQVDATDPRPDREIIKNLKSNRKTSISHIKTWNKSMELASKKLSWDRSVTAHPVPQKIK